MRSWFLNALILCFALDVVVFCYVLSFVLCREGRRVSRVLVVVRAFLTFGARGRCITISIASQ